MVRALPLEDGGGDLAPGLGVGDRHELAAVVEFGGEADLLLVAAQEHAADRAQGPERDQADEAPAGGAGQLLDLGHGSELQLDVGDRCPMRRRKLQEEKWCRLGDSNTRPSHYENFGPRFSEDIWSFNSLYYIV